MLKRLTYLEIPATAPEQSARFYESVLGWKIDERSSIDFRFSDEEAARIFGRFTTERSAAADRAGVLAYFTVPSVAASLERAAFLGGVVVAPPALEGDTLIARVRDPAGNVIGLWQFAEAPASAGNRD